MERAASAQSQSQGLLDFPPQRPPQGMQSSNMSEMSDGMEASSMQLARPMGRQIGGPTLLVSACGRSVPLSLEAGSSLTSLQSQLQTALHMEGQTFQFFDVQGTSLSSDQEIQDAVVRGQTPLCATLSDASIHYIENRREELAQMQWKLMRDQVTGATGKVAELNRRVQELSESLSTRMKEEKSNADRLRNELLAVVEGVREHAKGDLLQLSERVNAVTQLLAKERNVREVATQGVEKQVQGVRDAIEADRSLRRQEASVTASLIEDTKHSLEAETRSREAFEDRQAFDCLKLNERIDEITAQRNEDAQDYSHQFNKASGEAHQLLEAQGRQVLQLRAELEANAADGAARLQQLEDRSTSIEGRLGEAASRHMQSFERLSERNERLAQAVEQVRLGERTQGAGIQGVATRVEELEKMIKQSEVDMRDFCARERASREQLMRSAHQNMAAETSLKMTAVKEELQLRLERESAAREASVERMMEEVTAAVDDGNQHQQQQRPPPPPLQISIAGRTTTSMGRLHSPSTGSMPALMGAPQGSVMMTGVGPVAARQITRPPALSSSSIGSIQVPVAMAGSPNLTVTVPHGHPSMQMLQMPQALTRFSTPTGAQLVM